MTIDPVIIAPYNPAWVTTFLTEATLLRQAIPFPNVVIEHIGSTAVVGLAAKPIIDIMIGFESAKDADIALPAISGILT